MFDKNNTSLVLGDFVVIGGPHLQKEWERVICRVVQRANYPGRGCIGVEVADNTLAPSVEKNTLGLHPPTPFRQQWAEKAVCLKIPNTILTPEARRLFVSLLPESNFHE